MRAGWDLERLSRGDTDQNITEHQETASRDSSDKEDTTPGRAEQHRLADGHCLEDLTNWDTRNQGDLYSCEEGST